MIIPPPTPKRPAKNPESSPVNKKIIIKIVNNFSALKVFYCSKHFKIKVN